LIDDLLGVLYATIMTLAVFIDIVLTPLAGGVGAFLGLSWAVQKQPEKYQRVSNFGIRLLSGAVVALVLFALKVV
jgi:hypothetical protein